MSVAVGVVVVGVVVRSEASSLALGRRSCFRDPVSTSVIALGGIFMCLAGG